MVSSRAPALFFAPDDRASCLGSSPGFASFVDGSPDEAGSVAFEGSSTCFGVEAEQPNESAASKAGRARARRKDRGVSWRMVARIPRIARLVHGPRGGSLPR